MINCTTHRYIPTGVANINAPACRCGDAIPLGWDLLCKVEQMSQATATWTHASVPCPPPAAAPGRHSRQETSPEGSPVRRGCQKHAGSALGPAHRLVRICTSGLSWLRPQLQRPLARLTGRSREPWQRHHPRPPQQLRWRMGAWRAGSDGSAEAPQPGRLGLPSAVPMAWYPPTAVTRMTCHKFRWQHLREPFGQTGLRDRCMTNHVVTYSMNPRKENDNCRMLMSAAKP